MKKTIFACFGISFAVWLLVRKNSADSSISAWSAGKRIAGRFDQVKGIGKKTVGKVTGDAPLQAEGLVDEVLGTLKHGVGKAVAVAHDAFTS